MGNRLFLFLVLGVFTGAVAFIFGAKEVSSYHASPSEILQAQIHMADNPTKKVWVDIDGREVSLGLLPGSDHLYQTSSFGKVLGGNGFPQGPVVTLGWMDGRWTLRLIQRGSVKEDILPQQVVFQVAATSPTLPDLELWERVSATDEYAEAELRSVSSE